jgi:splicing factor 3A subunit 3
MVTGKWNKLHNLARSSKEKLVGFFRTRKAEIQTISGTDDFSEFYNRLKGIKDYHRRYPNEVVEPLGSEYLNRDAEQEETGMATFYGII